MQTINIVVRYNLFNKLNDIIGCRRVTRLHIPLPAVMGAEVATASGKGLLALTVYVVILPERQRDNPGMKLHAAFVALLNGKSQRVVAGVLACGTRKKIRERLYS